MSLNMMLPIIRDYFREKTSNELFSELSSLVQTQQETPTNFLIRAFQLREKVLVTSKVESGGYDEALVRSTFCRAVRTGLGNDQIRAHMKPFLNPKSSTPASDEVLLQEMNMASLEIEETLSKTNRGGGETIRRVAVKENRVVNQDDLSPILEGISMLKKQMGELQEAKSASTRGDTKSARRTRINQCQKCREVNAYCQHCFRCGSEKHQARQCDQKNE